MNEGDYPQPGETVQEAPEQTDAGHSLEECRTPDTHDQYVECVNLYSRSQTGEDPSRPANAVDPQVCWAWENGSVELTPEEQAYCRANRP